MIFCFSGVSFDTVMRDYSALISPNDIVVLSREVTGIVDMPAELSGKSAVFKSMVAFCLDKEIIMLVAMRAKIGDKLFNSVMVIDKGRIMGVSDEINPDKAYVGGKAMRSYVTGRGKVNVFVDSDVCYPELWQDCMDGSRYVFSLNACAANIERTACARALAIATGKYVLAQYSDSSLCINPYGRIESVKFSEMSAFYLPLSLAKGRTLKGKIRFVREKGN